MSSAKPWRGGKNALTVLLGMSIGNGASLLVSFLVAETVSDSLGKALIGSVQVHTEDRVKGGPLT